MVVYKRAKVQVGLWLMLGWMLSFSPSVYAQHIPDLEFERLSFEQGLSSHEITALLQDRQGFLWIGTIGGLHRYDGHQFTVFTHDPDNPHALSDNYININALFEDRNGLLWAGTPSGLNRFNPATGRFTTYRSDSLDATSLSHNNVWTILETTVGALWVGTQEGLNRLNPSTQTFTRYTHNQDAAHSLSFDAVTTLCENPGNPGTLWVGTRRGLNQYDPDADRFVRFTLPGGNDPRRYVFNWVTTLHCSPSGGVWVGTEGGTLNRLDPSTGRFTQYALPGIDLENPSRKAIHTIHEDLSGTLWIGARDEALNGFDPAMGAFTHYTSQLERETSLSNTEVTAIIEDRTGILWVGTWDGLNKVIRKKDFKTYTYHPDDPAHSLSHPRVHALHEDRDGRLWIGTLGGGLSRLDRRNDTFTHFRHDPSNPNSLSHDHVYSVAEDTTGTLWIGTAGGGLNRFDARSGVFRRYQSDSNDASGFSISSDLIYMVYPDKAGTLWVSTVDGGLNKVDPKTGSVTWYNTRNNATLRHDSVWPVYEDATGTLWVGTIGGGLHTFDRQSEMFTIYPDHSDTASGLRSNRILALNEGPDSTLWIGTLGGGLHRYDRTTGRFHSYTERNGLPHNDAVCILPDDHGDLWVGTGNGLFRLIAETNDHKTYDVSDGLPSPRFHANACLKSAGGELIFGTAEGIVSFYPDQLRHNEHISPVVLTGFDLFNAPALLDSAITHVRRITLPYDQNVVAFAFAALDFTDPPKNQYRYKLEGIDKDWVDARGQRYVRYPDLPPGTYTFRVKGSNNDGLWNEAGTSVRLVILPPFWKTWWFLMMVGLLALAAGVGVYRYRVRHLLQLQKAHHEKEKMTLEAERARQEGIVQAERARQATRKKIARDLHDDIGNELSSITFTLERTGRADQIDLPLRKTLLDLWQRMHRVSMDLRDMTWLVEFENDYLSGLIDRMHSITFQVFPNGEVQFKAPENAPDIAVAMDVRQDVFLIFKEALHNAARHAQATCVQVSIDYADGLLQIRVTDDGSGFDKAGLAHRNGLNNMAHRAQRIGATLAIDSRPGAGTDVRLSVEIA